MLKKSGYLDEYKGIRDLEHLFEEINKTGDYILIRLCLI